MKCPECGAWSSVLETRDRGSFTHRRHECANLHRFNSEQRVVESKKSVKKTVESKRN